MTGRSVEQLLEQTRELDTRIDSMLSARFDIGSQAHREFVRIALDCIEPLIARMFAGERRLDGNLACLEAVRKWANGEIKSVNQRRSDVHNAVASLLELTVDTSGLRHCLCNAVADCHPVFDGREQEQYDRMAAIIRHNWGNSNNATTILLVEDDRVLRQIIAENLRSRGYAVMTAVDGHDAYAQFVVTPRLFDVVLADYHMPGMYGDKLRNRIYAHCDEIEVPHPAVCIMSGAWAGAVGGDSGFIAKPFDTDSLVNTIQSLLAARRAA